MKTIIIIVFFATLGTVSFAQDTAYISRDKVTTLIFPSQVSLIGKVPANIMAEEKGNGVITLKAGPHSFSSSGITAREETSGQLHHITLQYSYGRAGGCMKIGPHKSVITIIKSPENDNAVIGNELASGERSNVVDRRKTGGIKAWLDKLSLAGNTVFFRLDIRNHSNLPYDIDFVRFYIRDLKTVARMATHEQEIVPVYSTLNKHTTIIKSKGGACVFAFHRFSLSGDQALNVEVYERNGNRHLYLQIRQRDLDHLETIHQRVTTGTSALAANEDINNHY